MKKTTYKEINILRILFLIFLLWQVSEVSAQEHRPLSLDEVIKEVMSNNWEIRKVEQFVGMAAADRSKANSVFLPSVSLSETYTTTTNPMLAFGTKLSQSSITASDFDPELLNNPDRTTNFNTQIEVQQPLINMDGIYGRKAAKLSYEAATHDESWAREMMTLQSKSMYFQLVLTIEGKKVVVGAQQAADASLEVSKDLFEQGLITRADLMGAALSATQMKSSLLQADNVIAHLNQSLLQLLGAQTNYTIVPTDSLPDHVIAVEALVDMMVPAHRADLMASNLKAEAGELNFLSKKGSFVPRMNAFGNYGFNDTQFFGTQANNYLVGVQLKWDIFNGGKNLGSVQRAKYEKEYAGIIYKEKLSNANRDLEKLKNDFVLAGQQVELAKLSAAQAAELQKVRSDRYAEGLEKTSDLLADESNLLQKRLDLLKSQNNYLQLLFKLETDISKELIN